MYYFASPGMCTIVMYKSQVSEILNAAVATEITSDCEIAAVSEKNKSELHHIPSFYVYPVLNIENIQTATSHTLTTPLMMISIKLRSRPNFF